MIRLGEAARFIRQEFGLSQRKAAEEIGISFVHLNNIENDKSSPSPEVIEKFRAAWGVDLYMVAAGMFSTDDHVPPKLRAPLAALTVAWRHEIKRLIARRRKELASQCTESTK